MEKEVFNQVVEIVRINDKAISILLGIDDENNKIILDIDRNHIKDDLNVGDTCNFIILQDKNKRTFKLIKEVNNG